MENELPVGDGHEVSATPVLTSYDRYAHQILAEMAAGGDVSQRSLSGRLGIALGLTNLLVCRLTQKGLVRIVRIKPHRVRYLLTPAGLAEKARMAQDAFQRSVKRYALARNRIDDAFRSVSGQWPMHARRKPVIFYGLGEVAEIGYICLQDSDLVLIAVIADADSERSRFFGVPVFRRDDCSIGQLEGAGEARVFVMSFEPREHVSRDLARLQLSADSAVWL